MQRRHNLSNFFEYLSAVFSNWLPLMSAGPFLIDRLATWTLFRWRKRFDEWPHRSRLLFFILLAGVFFAGFGAWKEEHNARIQAETKLSAFLTPPPSRNPDGLYQFGNLVGSVSGASENRSRSSVAFQVVRSNGSLDPTKELEYRDLILKCSPLPEGLPAGVVAEVFIPGPALGVTCSIIRQR